MWYSQGMNQPVMECTRLHLGRFFAGLTILLILSGCSLARFTESLPKAADLSDLDSLIGIWVARSAEEKTFHVLHFHPGRGNVIRLTHETEKGQDVFRGFVHRDGSIFYLSLQKRLHESTMDKPEVWMKGWWYFRFAIIDKTAEISFVIDPNKTTDNMETFGTGFFETMFYPPKTAEETWTFYKSPDEILRFLKSPAAKPLWHKWITFTHAFSWSTLGQAESHLFVPNLLPETASEPTFK